jgi:Collagenase and related proteases
MRFVELLSPAKNLECGLAAINHGADAVYIGASMFGARAAAGNSIADIEQLCRYAHQFKAKVLIALNTLLTDEELTIAEKLTWQLYEAGADALIVQDMGLLQLDLPPIALHASTQTDNRTAEKVQFLQNVGFSRVVLARELSLPQIADIAAKTDVELEAFVHGALCVSYSGQCYISQAMCGRSANRGECAQYCRLPYDLEDANGTALAKNKHLLSLKDLDLSDSLLEMMEAGVSSFKIEGRLKDANYVKNVTAYYRKKLDEILEGNVSYKRASSGKTRFFFEPNPQKTFRRDGIDYFLHGRKTDITQPETPKSIGESIGKVKYVGRNFIEILGTESINNGDGISYFTAQGELTGFRVNRVEGKQIFPASMPIAKTGVSLYRNQDAKFDKILDGKTSERKINVQIIFSETEKGFCLQLKDEDNIFIQLNVDCEKQLAQKAETVESNIKQQLSKLGNTIYNASEIIINLSAPWFIPASHLAEWRRSAIELLDEKRNDSYKRPDKKPEAKNVVFSEKELSYLGNVTNKKSHEFYSSYGVTSIMDGFEIKAEEGGPLMFCKHCLKHEMGHCPKIGTKNIFAEPLYLKYKNQRFKLTFDCKLCEMRVEKG